MLGSLANGNDISTFMVTANIGQKQVRNSKTVSLFVSISFTPCNIINNNNSNKDDNKSCTKCVEVC